MWVGILPCPDRRVASSPRPTRRNPHSSTKARLPRRPPCSVPQKRGPRPSRRLSGLVVDHHQNRRPSADGTVSATGLCCQARSPFESHRQDSRLQRLLGRRAEVFDLRANTAAKFPKHPVEIFTRPSVRIRVRTCAEEELRAADADRGAIGLLSHIVGVFGLIGTRQD